MPIPVIAIFDIGKTNKKIFLFDEDYKIVYEKSEVVPEIKDEDGFPCEDIHELLQWVKSSWNYILTLTDFDIKALNFSAHGASFVHLDKNGNIAAPLYNYLKPFPEHLWEKFNQAYNLKEVSRQTASPDLSNLNSGLQLYFLKYEKPEIFKTIEYSIHLPEFLNYIFTQQKVSALPSIGCHTLLWDFNLKDYHAWVRKEDLARLLSPIVACDSVYEIPFNSKQIKVGVGLHDSSSALIPYLKTISSTFTLISTGTWSISLNPFNQTELTQPELEQDCLCYLSYEGKPVKASRLLIGPEHDEQVRRIAEHFHVKEEFYKTIAFKHDCLSKTLHSNFADHDLTDFESPGKAYHALIQTIIKKQIPSTQLILNNSAVKEIYVDGGFSENSVFMSLLSKELSDYRIFGSSVSQASALGAAIVLHNTWNKKHFPEKTISRIGY